MSRTRRDVNVEPATGRVHAQLSFGTQRPMPFQFRMQPELKEALEAAVARNGRSLNAEIHARLEASFAEQFQAGGSEEVRVIIDRVRAAFLHGGRLGALSRGHPEWGPDEWMRDDIARKVAIAAAVDELRGVERLSAAMSDPKAVEQVMTAMIARGLPIEAKGGEK
jgi:Arc-like DNA binding domain